MHGSLTATSASGMSVTLSIWRAYFDLHSYFNQDIGDWNVGKVTTMEDMFNRVGEFNQDISDWDVSQVENMDDMFNNAEAFNQNIGGWDVSQVTDMEEMFSGASAFDQDIGNWKVGNVTNMRNMFNGATLSIDNYDALLAGWSMLSIAKKRSFSVPAKVNTAISRRGMC